MWYERVLSLGLNQAMRKCAKVASVFGSVSLSERDRMRVHVARSEAVCVAFRLLSETVVRLCGECGIVYGFEENIQS